MNRNQRVDATGTRRRLDALLAAGHTVSELAGWCGLDRNSVHRVGRRSPVANRSTAVRVYGAWLTRRPSGSGLWWDETELDAAVVFSTGPPSVRAGARLSVHVTEDLDDLAEQMGFCRQRGALGWEPRARRHVAARLGMTPESFDRAVYRGRAYQRQQGSAAA